MADPILACLFELLLGFLGENIAGRRHLFKKRLAQEGFTLVTGETGNLQPARALSGPAGFLRTYSSRRARAL